MSEPSIISTGSITDQAYHGTTYPAAESILVEGWRKSTGPEQLLGDGVYFFEDSPSMAKHWAKDRIKGPFVVLRSTVHFGVSLNLAESEHAKLVRHTANKLRESGVLDVTPAVAINALAKIAGIETVRAQRKRKTAWSIVDGGQLEWGIELLLCVKSLEKIVATDSFYTEIPTNENRS